jgi:hypothetical protein
MNRTNPSATVQDLAQRLIDHEAAPRDSSEANIVAAFRVSEKLRRLLSILTGATGFRTLLSRALTLAKAQVPCLNTVQVAPDGSLEGLSEFCDGEGGVMLIAQLLGLLVNFIGEPLTLRLVEDVWPDLLLKDTNSSEQNRHDPTR